MKRWPWPPGHQAIVWNLAPCQPCSSTLPELACLCCRWPLLEVRRPGQNTIIKEQAGPGIVKLVVARDWRVTCKEKFPHQDFWVVGRRTLSSSSRAKSRLAPLDRNLGNWRTTILGDPARQVRQGCRYCSCQVSTTDCKLTPSREVVCLQGQGPGGPGLSNPGSTWAAPLSLQRPRISARTTCDMRWRNSAASGCASGLFASGFF